MTEPFNQSTGQNPIGRFMVAVGAVMELGDTGKILLTRRNKNLDWHPGEWELSYGRMAQFESPEESLRREVKEELGITDFDIFEIIRVWHLFRGSETQQNELVGITYRCRTNDEKITISDEHEDYRWVTPMEALTMVAIEGIRKDVEEYIKTVNSNNTSAE